MSLRSALRLTAVCHSLCLLFYLYLNLKGGFEIQSEAARKLLNYSYALFALLGHGSLVMLMITLAQRQRRD